MNIFRAASAAGAATSTSRRRFSSCMHLAGRWARVTAAGGHCTTARIMPGFAAAGPPFGLQTWIGASCCAAPAGRALPAHGAFHQAAGDDGRRVADVERQLSFAQRDVGGGDAVEAAQVLGPGLVDDLLDVATRFGDV